MHMHLRVVNNSEHRTQSRLNQISMLATERVQVLVYASAMNALFFFLKQDKHKLDLNKDIVL